MACLKIKNQQGLEQWILEGTSYSIGWKFTGIIDMSCTGLAPETSGETVEEKLNKEGIQWGDAIAWTTKQLGIKQCAPCRARQEILNNVRKNGWLATIKAIKETL